VPNGITETGYRSFLECTSLSDINLAKSVKTIGRTSFACCTSLTNIDFLDHVQTIGAYAFYGCTGLTSVVVPDNVTTMQNSIFTGCANLTELTVPFVGYKAGSFIADQRYVLGWIFGNPNDPVGVKVTQHYGPGFSYSYYFPESLRKVTITSLDESIIDYGAFYGCYMLTSVALCDGVKYIDEKAFYNCVGLECVEIPDSVMEIDSSAFYNCSNLTIINYSGTTAQWESIAKGSDWDSNTGNYKIICKDGTISKDGV
jgi:hypothetical protein